MPVPAMIRKLGSVLLLLSMWLSVVQIDLGAYEPGPSSSITNTPTALSHLLTDQQPATAEGGAEVELAAGGGEPNHPPMVPGYGTQSPIGPSPKLHGLPPSRGPPPSSTPHNFQARAPPVA